MCLYKKSPTILGSILRPLFLVNSHLGYQYCIWKMGTIMLAIVEAPPVTLSTKNGLQTEHLLGWLGDLVSVPTIGAYGARYKVYTLWRY